jgi:uncharacterized protein (DUF2236 family)
VQARNEPHGAPLGPGSLTWRYFGDTRNLLVAQRAAVLQVMHPAIAAGLSDHSNVFENPIGRLVRSAGPILGVVYDSDAGRTARWIRDQHPRVRGTDARGRRYHALDPATYYWAHATFFEAQIATQELFGAPLSDDDKRQLYDESITWYRRYGLSMRPVPRDYDAFRDYWERMFDDVLEATAIARGAVRSGAPVPAPHPALRGPAWAVLEPVVTHAGPWLVRATLPRRAREILDVDWRPWDEAALRALRTSIRAAWPAVIPPLRRLPRARAAAAA